MLQVFYLDAASSMRDLNVSCNMKHTLWRVFPHHQLMANNFFQHIFWCCKRWLAMLQMFISMFQMLFFNVAMHRRSVRWEIFSSDVRALAVSYLFSQHLCILFSNLFFLFLFIFSILRLHIWIYFNVLTRWYILFLIFKSES